VAGRSPARAVGVARRAGAEFAAASAEEVLADDSIDVVVIATRHDSHAALAAEALEQGKAVFLEKPLAIDEKGVRLLEPLLASGARLVVDFNRSFAPAMDQLRSHFASVREPIFTQYRVNAGFLDPAHWLRDPDIGGGRLVGEACHFVDFCSALTRSPVVALNVVGLGDGPSTLEHDNFVLTLRYADGSVASISYIATGTPDLSKERIELIGGQRSAVVDDFRRVRLLPGRKADRPRARPQDKGHAGLLKASFEFFRNGGDPPIPYGRLLETSQATLLAYDALSRGNQDSIALERK
jgi:polar amino acid transport system substrate-binding protein